MKTNKKIQIFKNETEFSEMENLELVKILKSALLPEKWELLKTSLEYKSAIWNGKVHSDSCIKKILDGEKNVSFTRKRGTVLLC